MIPQKSPHQIDYSKFIKFHPEASGSAGRTIFIDPNLLLRFLELIDVSSDRGQAIARGIINLKSTAAGTASDSNRNSAFQHRTTVSNIVVTYSVIGEGVYVTNLNHGFMKDKSKVGMHKVLPSTTNRLRWDAEEDSSGTMPFPIGALGASPPSEVGEAGATATAAQFASGPLRKEARNISRGFSLFYVPTHSVDSMGVWLTSEQKSSSAQSDASRNFAQILAKASESTNRGGPEKYKWYVVGHAAKVFQNALQTYSSFSRKPLGEKHEFFFVDPQVPLGALQNDLRKNGIDFYHDRNVVDESMSLASRMHQFLDPEKVYLDMHRAYSFEREFNVNLKKANKVYADFGKSNVFFSDVVKKMLPLLTGRWR